MTHPIDNILSYEFDDVLLALFESGGIRDYEISNNVIGIKHPFPTTLMFQLRGSTMFEFGMQNSTVIDKICRTYHIKLKKWPKDESLLLEELTDLLNRFELIFPFELIIRIRKRNTLISLLIVDFLAYKSYWEGYPESLFIPPHLYPIEKVEPKPKRAIDVVVKESKKVEREKKRKQALKEFNDYKRKK